MPFQTNVIEMISEILDGPKAAAQSKLDNAEKKLEVRCKASEQFQSAVESAATMLAERKIWPLPRISSMLSALQHV